MERERNRGKNEGISHEFYVGTRSNISLNKRQNVNYQLLIN